MASITLGVQEEERVITSNQSDGNVRWENELRRRMHENMIRRMEEKLEELREELREAYTDQQDGFFEHDYRREVA